MQRLLVALALGVSLLLASAASAAPPFKRNSCTGTATSVISAGDVLHYCGITTTPTELQVRKFAVCFYDPDYTEDAATTPTVEVRTLTVPGGGTNTGQPLTPSLGAGANAVASLPPGVYLFTGSGTGANGRLRCVGY
jgi:hypothetical protein